MYCFVFVRGVLEGLEDEVTDSSVLVSGFLKLFETIELTVI